LGYLWVDKLYSWQNSPMQTWLVNLVHHLSTSLLTKLFSRSNQPLFTNLEPAQIAPKHIYTLTGQKFFPDSNSPNFPKFLAGPRKDFPRALQLVNADQFDTTEWAQHCRRVLDEELPKYGVVLFRGLPFDGNQFVTFAKSLGYSSAGYEGGTGYKPGFDEESMVTIPSDHRDMNLEPHNEMAYWPHSPKKVCPISSYSIRGSCERERERERTVN